MFDAEVSGEKSLIASIINQAISDSVVFENPRHAKDRGFRLARQKKLLAICLNCLEVIENPDKYSNGQIAFSYRLINKMPKTLFRKATNQKEEIAWGARQFLSAKSELFRIYTAMLDIDAEYLEEKIAKEISLYEAGIKRYINN